MHPFDFLMKGRLGRAKQMGLGADAVETPQADDNAFPTATDPTAILQYMTEKSNPQGRLMVPRPLRQYTPQEQAELDTVREQKRIRPHASPHLLRLIPGAMTEYGKVAHDRFHRRQAKIPSHIGQFEQEQETLAQTYGPIDDLKKRFR